MRDRQRSTNTRKHYNTYLSIREYKRFAFVVKVLWNVSIFGYILASITSVLFLIYSYRALIILCVLSMIVAIVATILTTRFYKDLKTGKRRQKMDCK